MALRVHACTFKSQCKRALDQGNFPAQKQAAAESVYSNMPLLKCGVGVSARVCVQEREKCAIHIVDEIVIVFSDSGQLEPSEVNAASRRADLRRRRGRGPSRSGYKTWGRQPSPQLLLFCIAARHRLWLGHSRKTPFPPHSRAPAAQWCACDRSDICSKMYLEFTKISILLLSLFSNYAIFHLQYFRYKFSLIEFWPTISNCWKFGPKHGEKNMHKFWLFEFQNVF